MTNMPATTPIADLARWAKKRWRIQHDHRELQHGLGLDHFEGRSWRGWHHRVTLVTLQALLRCWTGTCTTCGRTLPRNRTSPRT
ncbi:hypothetical protein [Streptomyces sp. NPDC002994]|uniref:hypothetical protein n=1 Tax=Streptomyces sp. NPDC002994 TaxID=3154441 RepID=UPI0033A31410